MRTKIALAFAICLVATVSAFAQQIDEIEGAGTATYVPLFTGTHRIGSSKILQLPNGNIGVGWTSPQYPLHIFTADQPGALFVQAQASVNENCSSCRLTPFLVL